MPPELHGPRLTLRPLSAADAAFYCAIYTDAELMAEVDAPLSEAAARRAFAAALAANARADPLTAYWVVVEGGMRSDIGLIGLLATNPGTSVRRASPSIEPTEAPVGAGSAREPFGPVVESSRAQRASKVSQDPPGEAAPATTATSASPVGEGAAAEAEVGAIIRCAWHSRGYAAEAIGLLADHAFAVPACTRLHTRHAASNAAAIGLMEKLGFAPIATVAELRLGHGWELQRATWIQRGHALTVTP